MLRAVRVFVGTVLALSVLLAGAGPATAGEGAAGGTIQWGSCGPELPPSLQCGELAVPLDHRQPRGAKITLGFNRLPAENRARRVGSLIINPGGPGGPGSQFVAIEAAGLGLWHPDLHRRFDLIGMDPRGIGTSTPVRCDPALALANQSAPLLPRNRAEFAQLADSARAFGASCLRLTGPLLGHVDTASVARDMEILRRALGDGKLNFLGQSYGAQLGVQYAELYPTRIRAMALDSILDHSVSVNTLYADGAEIYEAALTRFAAWCGRARSCALRGRNVLALFDRLVRQADRQPIPAPQCVGQPCLPTVTGWDIRRNAFRYLLTKVAIPAVRFEGWKGFATALAQAEGGDASAFSEGLATIPEEFGGLAVACADHADRIRSFADLRAKILLGRAVAPHLQVAPEAWIALTGCMGWPVPVANPERRPRIRGTPPILLVSANHDPSVAYAWAHELLRQVPSAVLLTRNGDGHTSLWLGEDSRTNDAIADYLITRDTPPPNTVYPN